MTFNKRLKLLFMMILATCMTAIATFRYAGVLALLGVTLVWGTTFPAMKLLANDVPALHILALRFGLASVVLLPLFVRLRGAEWRWGLVLGLLNFIAFWLQTEGLALISSNRNAFITGLNVLIVPLLAWVVLRRPMGWAIALACALALGGLQLMFFEDSAWSWGDTLTLSSAVFFALFILTLELCALRNRQQPLRATRLAAVVSLTMCVCSVLVALGMEAQPLLGVARSLPWGSWLSLGYLAVVASVGVVVLQAWGQQRVDATRSAIIYGLEPVFAAITAWWWIGERMHAHAMLGAALLVSALMVSQWGSAPASAPQAAKPRGRAAVAPH